MCYLSESLIFEKICQRNDGQGNKNSIFFSHSPDHHSSDTSGFFLERLLNQGARHPEVKKALAEECWARE
jgi:hypothetical protein